MQWGYRESQEWLTKAENHRGLDSTAVTPQILGKHVFFKIPEKGCAGLSLLKAKDRPQPKLGRIFFLAISGLVSYAIQL